MSKPSFPSLVTANIDEISMGDFVDPLLFKFAEKLDLQPAEVKVPGEQEGSAIFRVVAQRLLIAEAVSVRFVKGAVEARDPLISSDVDKVEKKLSSDTKTPFSQGKSLGILKCGVHTVRLKFCSNPGQHQ